MPLSHRVASGAAWTAAQALLAKFVTIIGQLILASILLPDDFGIIALAYTVTTLTALVSQFGLTDVLTQRGRKLEHWHSPALSLSLATGLTATGVGLLLAPIWAWIYHDGTVGWLIVIQSLSAPIQSISTFASSRLRRDMRFGTFAMVRSVAVVVQMGLTILMAVLGFGPYSFAVPPVIVAVGTSWYYIRITRHGLPARKGWAVHQWKYLVGNSVWGMIGALFARIVNQGDYLILGLFAAKDEVGRYFMAFSLSVQAIQLVSNNLATVLLPALTLVKENPARLQAAYLRSAKAMALISMPLCFLQAAIADPAVRLVFKPEWYPMIQFIQILSIGIAYQSVSVGCGSLWRVLGKFRESALISGLSAAYFLLFVAPCSWYWGAIGTVIGVAVYHLTINPIMVRWAIGLLGGTWSQVADLYLRPTLISIVSLGPISWLASRPWLTPYPIAQIVIVTLGGGCLYWRLSKLFNRVAWTDFERQIIGMFASRLQRKIA